MSSVLLFLLRLLPAERIIAFVLNEVLRRFRSKRVSLPQLALVAQRAAECAAVVAAAAEDGQVTLSESDAILANARELAIAAWAAGLPTPEAFKEVLRPRNTADNSEPLTQDN